MFRSLASNTLTVLILGFFLVGALGVWGKSQFVNDGPLQSAICFKVVSGSTLRTVAKNLVKDLRARGRARRRRGARDDGARRDRRDAHREERVGEREASTSGMGLSRVSG